MHSFESKPRRRGISLPKDEYEKIASLYLRNRAGRDGVRPVATAARSFANGDRVGFSQPFARKPCRQNSPEDGKEIARPPRDRDRRR